MDNSRHGNQLDSCYFLEPAEIRVFRTKEGHIQLDIGDGEYVTNPSFLLIRPLIDPNGYISIQDSAGKELWVLRNWKQLDDRSREIVKTEIDRHYLLLVVKRIVSVKRHQGQAICTFETNRGICTATLGDFHESVIYLSETRVLVTDINGNRYDIPDTTDLDQRSAYLFSKMI